MLSEAVGLARELGDNELLAEAMEWRIAGLIALGDLDRAGREQATVHAMAERLRQPFTLHVAEHYASTMHLSAGRLARAEAAAHRSHEWSRLLTGRNASSIHGIQMFSIRREQGRLAELAPAVRLLARSDRSRSAWGPGLAALFADLGMDDDVRRQLELIREQGFDSLRPSLWLGSLTYLADACAAVADEELAAEVYAELAPLTGANVMIGHGVAFYGSADRYLGRLAATMREHDRAIEHYELAVARNRAMGATTWLAHALAGQGESLLARGRADDRHEAMVVLGEAAALAERIGMPTLLSRVQALGGRAEPPAIAAPDDLTGREVEILRMVASGRSNREIGDQLFISRHTVANHIRSILRKTGAANRTEAAGYAHRHSLL
jgi:DNA-binding CsgD family transcriptional regulator/tetratricopeptide (TPR) repeat protein